MSFDNAANRFGSARLAGAADLRKIGMFEQKPNSLLVGFWGDRPLWYSGMGGLLMCAGARGGKLATILGYNVCHGVCASSMAVLDMKGELAAISRNQAPDKKHCIYWNPAGLHGLPQNRLNPVDYICIDSPSLVSDVKVFCENMIPASGSPQAVYFERRAQEFLEGIVLTLVRQKGVLTLPDIYAVVNTISGGGHDWLNFAFEMSESGFPVSVRVEEEIAASRDNPSGGMQGILGEIYKAFACLSDPILMQSVSPPYDFSLGQMCENNQAYQFYLMPPAEFIDAWSPVIKAMFVAAMIYKSRSPQAPQQTWILDECAQLGKFPLVVKLFTYGAGIGIRPWAVFQSTYQMKALGSDAENIVTSSASLRSYFAVRDIQTAQTVSNMIGVQTLDYDDDQRHEQLRFSRQQAVQAMLSGGDPVASAMQAAHVRRQMEMPPKQYRQLRTPDEVLNTPDDRQYVFTDGLPGCLYAGRKRYFEQRFMAGRYHPNPFHPPPDRVRVKTRFGHGWRRVLERPVPPHLASTPQYRNHPYSIIEE